LLRVKADVSFAKELVADVFLADVSVVKEADDDKYKSKLASAVAALRKVNNAEQRSTIS